MKTKIADMWTLYVLKLESDKWYVGITSKSAEHRFKQHQNGFGSSWTRKYKPLKIHYQEQLDTNDIERAQLYEGRVTRKYMEEYGDNNVRGGDLTDIGDYTRRLGRFWLKSDWEIIAIILLELIAIVYLLVDKYFVN